MTLSTENHANKNFSQGVSGGTINYTTSGSNRIAVLVIAGTVNGAGSVTVTGVSSASGSWAQRKRYAGTLVFGQTFLEIWWIYVPTAVTGETITISLSGAIDGLNASVRSVVGCTNFTNPWDGNASLATANAVRVSGDGFGTISNVAGVSTTNANTVVFACWTSDTSQGNPTDLTADTGWTLTDNLYNPNPSKWNYNVVEEKVFSTQLSAANVLFGSTGGHTEWVMTVDALTDASGITTAPSHPAAALAIGV